MEAVHLNDNYRRSLSASLMLVEKLVSEIESMMLHQAGGVYYHITNDLTGDHQAELLKLISEIKATLLHYKHKYNLKCEESNLAWLIKSRKSKIWEILCESDSHGMRGYGKLPETLAGELDADVAKLLALTEKL